MRLGDKQPDLTGEVRGMRVVGRYVHAPQGWRRMTFDEAFYVHMDRTYRDVMERPSPFYALVKFKHPGYNGIVATTAS